MKKFDNTRPLPIMTIGVIFFFLLLPVDLVWSPTLIVIKVAVNAVSVLVYMGILSALWGSGAEPVEHGGLLFVLGLVTLPYLLFLPVFYYSGMFCAAVSVVLAVALLVDRLSMWKKRE